MAIYACRRCGYQQEIEWKENCPGCRGLYRPEKVRGSDTPGQKEGRSTFAAAADATEIEHIPTGLVGFDDVLSGGLVAGDALLFGGFRGAGKSTLLVTAMDSMAKRRKAFYASSEQSAAMIVEIARRIGSRTDNVVVHGGQKYIEDTLALVKSERPFAVVYDSLQKYLSYGCGATPGSAAQGLAVASLIKEDCRASGRAAIVVNQMSRQGELKGGTDVEHDLDAIAVLSFPDLDKDEEAPGDATDGIRVLTVDKNRNGSEDLKSYWHMHGKKDLRPGTIEHVPAKSKIVDIRRGKYNK